jgi:hypothetical protein
MISHRLRTVSLAGTCVLLWAFSSIAQADQGASPAGRTDDAQRRDLATFAFDGFDPGILPSDGDAAKKLVERFGLPLKVERKRRAHGREPGTIIEVEIWRYDGLEVDIWGDYGSTKRWISQITLTSPKYKLKFGLAIGSPKKAFVERLGPPNPNYDKSDHFSYLAGPEYVSVDIYFDKSGLATKIVWAAHIA